MIISIEGPDCSGKSTLFDALKKVLPAHYVRTTTTPALLAVMSDMETAHLQLWEALYDPSQLYVCDRSLFVSGLVYGKLYGRKLPDIDGWRSRVHVVYLECLLSELEHRYRSRGDEMFSEHDFRRVLDLYREVLPLFSYIRVDATAPIAEQTKLVYDYASIVRASDASDAADRVMRELFQSTNGKLVTHLVQKHGTEDYPPFRLGRELPVNEVVDRVRKVLEC